MRKETVVALCINVLFSAGAILAAQERTVVVGGASGWEALARRENIQELDQVRRVRTLALSSARPVRDADLDLALSFDQPSAAEFFDALGRYSLSAAPGVSSADGRRARHGSGAALFSESPLTLVPRRGALFASGSRPGDFSIEFWMFPANMENGEQILSWSAGRRTQGGEQLFPRIRCLTTRNRVEWTFSDIFSSPDDRRRLPLSLSTHGAILPGTWSHHLLRFDADTGLLEYLVDGKLEGLVYATSTGREGGDVFLPIIGDEGALVLGARFTGMMDEFRVYRRRLELPDLSKFPAQGGRLETRFIDLGATNSSVLRLEAFGDRNASTGTTGAASSGADIRFYLRAADTPYLWKDDESGWAPVEPGASLAGRFRGRWVQAAAVLYPSGDGERTPYLDEIRIVYEPDLPPSPPTQVTAVAKDGAVELSWRAGIEADLGGYLVYYGTSRENYFGTDALLGPSPLDVGNRTSVRIDGLRNGTLYYFSIAAYDRADPPHGGDLSREATARPVRMMP